MNVRAQVRISGLSNFVCFAATICFLLQVDAASACERGDDCDLEPAKKSRPSLVDLMTEADVVLVGTAVAHRRNDRNTDFIVGGHRIRAVSEIVVEQMLASKWSDEETGRNMFSKGDERRRVLVLEVPSSFDYDRDPGLLTGGQFLLWLRHVDVPEEDAERYGFRRSACYRTIRGVNGAVFLPDTSRFPSTDQYREVSDLYERLQEEGLLRNFGTTDTSEVLETVEEFAAGLKKGEAKLTLPRFVVHGARATEVVDRICHAFQVCICVEEANQQRRLVFSLRKATAEDVLNKIVEMDPAYIWQRDKKTGTINLYPKRDAPLSWRVENLDIRTRTVWRMLGDKDPLGLKRYGITRTAVVPSVGWSPVSLHLESATARQALNQLCSQLKFKARWELCKDTDTDGGYVLRIKCYDVRRFGCEDRRQKARSLGSASKNKNPTSDLEASVSARSTRPARNPTQDAAIQGSELPFAGSTGALAAGMDRETVTTPESVMNRDAALTRFLLGSGFAGAAALGALGIWLLVRKKKGVAE